MLRYNLYDIQQSVSTMLKERTQAIDASSDRTQHAQSIAAVGHEHDSSTHRDSVHLNLQCWACVTSEFRGMGAMTCVTLKTFPALILQCAGGQTRTGWKARRELVRGEQLCSLKPSHHRAVFLLSWRADLCLRGSGGCGLCLGWRRFACRTCCYVCATTCYWLRGLGPLD